MEGARQAAIQVLHCHAPQHALLHIYFDRAAAYALHLHCSSTLVCSRHVTEFDRIRLHLLDAELRPTLQDNCAQMLLEAYRMFDCRLTMLR